MTALLLFGWVFAAGRQSLHSAERLVFRHTIKLNFSVCLSFCLFVRLSAQMKIKGFPLYFDLKGIIFWLHFHLSFFMIFFLPPLSFYSHFFYPHFFVQLFWWIFLYPHFFFGNHFFTPTFFSTFLMIFFTPTFILPLFFYPTFFLTFLMIFLFLPPLFFKHFDDIFFTPIFFSLQLFF